MPGRPERKRTDRLYPPRQLGPRQLDALRAVEALPGLTVVGLATVLGVSVGQAGRIADRLAELGRLDRLPPRAAEAAADRAA